MIIIKFILDLSYDLIINQFFLYYKADCQCLRVPLPCQGTYLTRREGQAERYKTLLHLDYKLWALTVLAQNLPGPCYTTNRKKKGRGHGQYGGLVLTYSWPLSTAPC